MVDGLPDSGSSGFGMTDCRILFHTKQGMRTSNGFHHAKFVRCIADGGRKDYANIEPRDIFSVGFQLMGSYRGKGGRKADHHVEFIDCETNNNYYDAAPKRYWNVGRSGHQCGFWALGGGEVDYIGCTSKGEDVPFSVEAHGKEGEPPPEPLMKIRNCKVEPKGERIYGRMDGNITVNTDGSVAKQE